MTWPNEEQESMELISFVRDLFNVGAIRAVRLGMDDQKKLGYPGAPKTMAQA